MSSPVSNGSSDAADLLSQYVPETMSVEKALQTPAILRLWLQIIQCRLERNSHTIPVNRRARYAASL